MKIINGIVDLIARLFRFTVGLLGGILGLIVSLVIIGLNIYVSFFHTLELYQQAGVSHEGYMDVAATVALELTFVSGSIINIINIKKRKHWKQRKVSIGVGVGGIALIMWSNISALSGHGLTGIILGAVTPLSIIAWEFILAEVYAGQDQTQTDTTQTEAENTQTRTDAIQTMTDSVQTETDILSDMPSELSEVTDNQSDRTSSHRLFLTTKQVQAVRHSPTKKDASESHTDTSDEVTVSLSEPNKSTPVNRVNYLLDESDSNDPVIIAKRFKLQTGEFPTIRQLAEVADISRYKADKTLKEIRQTDEGVTL